MKLKVFKIGTYVRCEQMFIDAPAMAWEQLLAWLTTEKGWMLRCHNEFFMIFQDKDKKIYKLDMEDLREWAKNYGWSRT